MLSKTPILPPWWRFPKFERYCIGWRMGTGEDYLSAFYDYFDSLSLEEKQEYCSLFNEPPIWDGFYRDTLHADADKDDDVYMINGEVNSASSTNFVKLWQSDGKPLFKDDYILENLKPKHDKDFVCFWGHKSKQEGVIDKSCFSQWFKLDFVYMAQDYCCMEQFMMAQKAELFHDAETKEKILNCSDPAEIKQLGRQVKGFNEVIWNLFKYPIVLNGNFLKFSQNLPYAKFLLDTHNKVIVEASPNDKIWGVGLDANNDDIYHINKWQGENLLGRALMEVRSELKKHFENLSLCSNYDDFARQLSGE